MNETLKNTVISTHKSGFFYRLLAVTAFVWFLSLALGAPDTLAYVIFAAFIAAETTWVVTRKRRFTPSTS